MVDTILESASRVLEKHALAGYNTTTVAEQAGVSIGSVYQYFPNRDALTAELILRMHRTLIANLRETLQKTADMPLEEALPAMIGAGIPPDLKSHKLARVLEFEEERLPRSAELLELEREIDSLVVQFLQRYLEPGLPPKTIEVSAIDMVSIIRGMTDMSITRAAALDDLTERIARALLGYLAPLLASRAA